MLLPGAHGGQAARIFRGPEVLRRTRSKDATIEAPGLTTSNKNTTIATRNKKRLLCFGNLHKATNQTFFPTNPFIPQNVTTQSRHHWCPPNSVRWPNSPPPFRWMNIFRCWTMPSPFFASDSVELCLPGNPSGIRCQVLGTHWSQSLWPKSMGEFLVGSLDSLSRVISVAARQSVHELKTHEVKYQSSTTSHHSTEDKTRLSWGKTFTRTTIAPTRLERPPVPSRAMHRPSLRGSRATTRRRVWSRLRPSNPPIRSWNVLEPLVASLLLVAMPGAPSSILAPSSDARSP